MMLVGVVSVISYLFVENMKFKKNSGKYCITPMVAVLSSLFVVVSATSFIFYMRAGVVRDVPELDIYKDSVSRGMHAEYNHRIREYNNDFGKNDLLHVLLVGDSFARDWGNVLLESDMVDEIEISYIEGSGENLNDRQLEMCDEAGRIFWAVSGFRDLPDDLYVYYEEGKLFIVGNKKYGESNGIAYNQKRNDDYYDFHVALGAEFMSLNEKQKGQYGEQYIDMLEPVINEDGTISIYTRNHKFISQDCRHLTRNGAFFYAEILDIKNILGIVEMNH